MVRAEPADAAIFVNGKEVGRGSIQLEEMVGRYVVVAEMGSLYYPAREEVQLTEDGARVFLTLRPNFGGVHITSTPSGAEVWLDGERVGDTPWLAPQKTPCPAPR